MAKALVLVSALCFLAFASLAHAQGGKPLNVAGMVYCDPCKVEFQTRLSQPISGAKVQLQCRRSDDGINTVTVDAVTGQDGSYTLSVAGDHEEEICEVSTVSSPNGNCNVPFDEIDKARVLLTEKNGVRGTDRYANPIGFKTTSLDPGCIEVLNELDMLVV